MKVESSTNRDGITEITVLRECIACEGTGLYAGYSEGEGAAVVCWKCNGVGEEKISLIGRTFTGRLVRPGVRRVFQSNPGLYIDKNTLGGKSYSDWLTDDSFRPGEENRTATCPAWWYQQADPSKKPCWSECVTGIRIGYQFVDCDRFRRKKKCWEKFDREINQA